MAVVELYLIFEKLNHFCSVIQNYGSSIIILRQLQFMEIMNHGLDAKLSLLFNIRISILCKE